jgi:hypothetical protein
MRLQRRIQKRNRLRVGSGPPGRRRADGCARSITDVNRRLHSQPPGRGVVGVIGDISPTMTGHRGPSLYCLSYTSFLLTLWPFASVPLVVTVRLLPSADTTIRPLVIILPPFKTLKLNVTRRFCVRRASDSESLMTGYPLPSNAHPLVMRWLAVAADTVHRNFTLSPSAS